MSEATRWYVTLLYQTDDPRFGFIVGATAWPDIVTWEIASETCATAYIDQWKHQATVALADAAVSIAILLHSTVRQHGLPALNAWPTEIYVCPWESRFGPALMPRRGGGGLGHEPVAVYDSTDEVRVSTRPPRPGTD